MNIKTTILTGLAILASAMPALAQPVTYYGSKGEYTVNSQAGTYRGCVYKTGCIYLGRNRKVGIGTWKNGDTTYSIGGGVIQVYRRGRVIFQDSFN